MYKERCYNGGQKHSFSPRYEKEVPSINMTDFEMSLYAYDKMIEGVKKLSKTVYLYDVCKWCGKKTER